jgi:hypothetical protein
MRNLPLLLTLSLAALAGCGGDAIIAMNPDGGGSSGSSSGSGGSGSTSGSGGSGSASSGTAGSGSASSGTGGSGCAQDSDCPNNEMCGFPENPACTAVGKCFPRPQVMCLAYAPACACDGTTINVACTGFPAGYASKPFLHSGVCTDAGPACFTDPVPPTYKACAVDSDCAIKTHQSDCCGTLHVIGVSQSLSSTYDTCESNWDHHFPGCGCPPMITTTDDGNGVLDASRATVHCVSSTSSGAKTCQTTAAPGPAPPDAGGPCTSNADCGGNTCGFPASAACGAKGTCFPAELIVCQAYAAGCACDGSEINVTCNGLPNGYETKPLRHTGSCVDGG